MIRTLNLNRQTTAILENAYNIGYEKQVNSIWQASFSLPLNDPKVDKVEMLKYVEITDNYKVEMKDDSGKVTEVKEVNEYIGLFRIMPKSTIKNESKQEVTFKCEHVLSTLMDSSLFKYHQMTNYTTEQVLQYLLDQQNHKHWKLGQVDFTRYFHYGWENDNLLASIFSVPQPFNEQHIWEHDTRSYPWNLELIEPSNEPVCRIKDGYNLVGLEIEENPMSMYNRIYPLGAGEGVNQLTIESINNGVPYLEDIAPGEEIKEVVWVDRRFTDVESLMASGQALLDRWKKPIVTWRITAADLSKITGLSIDKFKVGTVVRLDIKGYPITDLRIMKESKPDIKGDPGNIQLEIGNVTEDLATTETDLQRRQQINELYSQGATNILNFTYQDNADEEIPATIPFYIDDDVVNINTVELTFRTRRFRAYSQATKGGGSLVKSTGGGGGTVKSTSSGGGTSKSTSSGGGSTATSSSGGGTSTSTQSGGGGTQTSGQANGWEVTIIPYVSGNAIPRDDSHVHGVNINAADFDHWHTVDVPNHTHDFSTPDHTHNVNIPNHSHEFTVPAHTHDIDLPNHTHEIELPDHIHEVEHKIVELSFLPSSVVIKVDGNTVPHTSTSGNRINLVDYMSKDSSGKITRGRHEVTITPNGLGRIEADLILRVFIQSQIGEVF